MCRVSSVQCHDTNDGGQEVAMARSQRWAGFRSLLCPIDFSEQSRRALKYAETIASRGNAALAVAYVNDPLLVAAAGAALHDDSLVKKSGQELQDFVAVTLSPGATETLVKYHISIGDPAAEILKAASRCRSDLIVLGTHGLTGAERLLVGSTTLSVLQQTTVPVLAVPGSNDSPADGPSPGWPGARIVVALELDSASTADVDIAAHVAEWFGSSLLLVHVVGDVAAPDWLEADLSAHERIRVAQAQQRIEALAERAQRRVKCETRIVCGRIADEIAALAATERVGLVMTALRDRRGWFGARRGAVSNHVLSHVATPVLAVPPKWGLRI
jgi:nucleotide-binding universal stress UspA family protein